MKNLPANKIPLDLPSEGIFAWEHGQYTQTDYAGFLLRGKCDIEAMKVALVKPQETRPTFHSYLVASSDGPWRKYQWLPVDQMSLPEVRDFSHLENMPDDLDAFLYDQLHEFVETPRDLSRQFSIRLFLFLLPFDHCFVVFMFHHVTTDGAGVYDYTREVFSHYHFLITGQKPDWANVYGIHAQAGGIKPVKAISLWEFAKRGVFENKKFPMSKLAQFHSTPENRPRRMAVRHIIDDVKTQKALRDRVRREGGTITDLFLASSKLAIQQWNQERNKDSEIMYHGIAVNLRLRLPASQTKGLGNPMSGMTIPSNSTHRKNPEDLLRYVINERKTRMDLGYDIALSGFSRKFLRLGKLLPLSLRYPLLRKIFDMKISHFLTNLGIVWPEIENGKPTGQTAITHTGNLELVDIYSCVGPTEKNPQSLILRSLHGRLYMTNIFGSWAVNEKDANDFSQLIFDKVLAFL